jgi:hypothetical protein
MHSEETDAGIRDAGRGVLAGGVLNVDSAKLLGATRSANSQPYDERLLSIRRSNRLSLGHLAHVQISQLYIS